MTATTDAQKPRGARMVFAVPADSRPQAERLALDFDQNGLSFVARRPRDAVRGQHDAGWLVVVFAPADDELAVPRSGPTDRAGVPVLTDSERLNGLVECGLVPVVAHVEGGFALGDVEGESPRECIDRLLAQVARVSADPSSSE